MSVYKGNKQMVYFELETPVIGIFLGKEIFWLNQWINQ